MNKTEMIEAVASETGLAKTEVAKVLNAYTAEIIKAVATRRGLHSNWIWKILCFTTPS